MKKSAPNKAAGPEPTRAEVDEILKNLLDPELGLDIQTLGFVRRVELDGPNRAIRIVLTLTSPLCPFGPTIAEELRSKLRLIGLKKIQVEFEFDPPWEPSAEVRLMLGV